MSDPRMQNYFISISVVDKIAFIWVGKMKLLLLCNLIADDEMFSCHLLGHRPLGHTKRAFKDLED